MEAKLFTNEAVRGYIGSKANAVLPGETEI
jgi:hypothetical protein